jgi:hypothetical protein
LRLFNLKIMNALKILKTTLKWCGYVAVFAEFIQFAIKKIEPFFDDTENTTFEDLPAEKE